MDDQHQNQQNQADHHDLRHTLQSLLHTSADHQKAENHRECHEYRHFHRITQHPVENRRNIVPGSCTVKLSCEKLPEIIQHPPGNRGVIHHQQIAARHAEIAVNMPPAPRRLQRPVALHRGFAARAAHSQLHAQHRHAHNDQKNQIKQHKNPAAVLSRDEREFPHIPYSDRASRADQQKSEPAAEVFSLLHSVPPMLPHSSEENLRFRVCGAVWCPVPQFSIWSIPRMKSGWNEQRPFTVMKNIARLMRQNRIRLKVAPVRRPQTDTRDAKGAVRGGRIRNVEARRISSWMQQNAAMQSIRN